MVEDPLGLEMTVSMTTSSDSLRKNEIVHFRGHNVGLTVRPGLAIAPRLGFARSTASVSAEIRLDAQRFVYTLSPLRCTSDGGFGHKTSHKGLKSFAYVKYYSLYPRSVLSIRCITLQHVYIIVLERATAPVVLYV